MDQQGDACGAALKSEMAESSETGAEPRGRFKELPTFD
jgi:hypothetical protein